MIPSTDEEGDQPPSGAPPDLPPDDVEFNEQGEMGEQGEVQGELMSDEQIAEMWLRRLQSSPADFLRRRFEAEYQRRRSEGGS